MAKILLSYGLNMVLTLSFKLVFLNPKQYSKGYFMPNFTLLCVSYGLLSYKWPKYGPFMAKTWLSYDTTTWFILNLNQCAQRYSMPNFILLGVSCSPLSRNGQHMALLWPKHGPHTVLQIGFSWTIINVPRDSPCKISQFLVYPIVPFF